MTYKFVVRQFPGSFPDYAVNEVAAGAARGAADHKGAMGHGMGTGGAGGTWDGSTLAFLRQTMSITVPRRRALKRRALARATLARDAASGSPQAPRSRRLSRGRRGYHTQGYVKLVEPASHRRGALFMELLTREERAKRAKYIPVAAITGQANSIAGTRVSDRSHLESNRELALSASFAAEAERDAEDDEPDVPPVVDCVCRSVLVVSMLL